MERYSARGAIQPGPKILAQYLQTGLGFSARPNGLKNPCNLYHFFHPGPKKEREHTHRLCFRTSVNFLIEILYAFCARAEIEHVIATIESLSIRRSWQHDRRRSRLRLDRGLRSWRHISAKRSPCGRSEISGRAETHHAIRLLFQKNNENEISEILRMYPRTENIFLHLEDL